MQDFGVFERSTLNLSQGYKYGSNATPFGDAMKKLLERPQVANFSKQGEVIGKTKGRKKRQPGTEEPLAEDADGAHLDAPPPKRRRGKTPAVAPNAEGKAKGVKKPEVDVPPLENWWMLLRLRHTSLVARCTAILTVNSRLWMVRRILKVPKNRHSLPAQFFKPMALCPRTLWVSLLISHVLLAKWQPRSRRLMVVMLVIRLRSLQMQKSQKPETYSRCCDEEIIQIISFARCAKKNVLRSHHSSQALSVS